MRAPPPIAMIINADPFFRCTPNPFVAKGQMEGHISEFANPKKEMNKMEVTPEVTKAHIEKVMPATAHILNAFSWLRRFGISSMPAM